MFGLSWDQIILILLAALFLLGPERIPTAVKWVMDSLRKLRTMAAGAQSEFQSQMGSEMEELRRQVADLQSLKELQELRQLRDLDPRRMIGKSVLGPEFSGGVKGFLGLSGDGPGAAAPADQAAATGQAPAGERAATRATPNTAPTPAPTSAPAAAPTPAPKAAPLPEHAAASWLDVDGT